MTLRKPEFEEQAKKLGEHFEKIYGLDGKENQFLIETDYR